MAVVISLNRFMAPVDDTVTAHTTTQSHTKTERRPARTGRSQGNLARTPDVAVVISLNWFMAPVDDTVTAQHQSQSHKKLPEGGVTVTAVNHY